MTDPADINALERLATEPLSTDERQAIAAIERPTHSAALTAMLVQWLTVSSI